MDADRLPPDTSRRTFLGTAAGLAGLVAGVIALAGAARFAIPLRTIRRARRLIIGRRTAFPPGARSTLADEKLIVVSTARGIYALSTVCTHLGCTVRDYRSSLCCTCHGSVFGIEGEVLGGPAPRPLPWMRVGQWPQGELYVDLGERVPAGTYFEHA